MLRLEKFNQTFPDHIIMCIKLSEICGNEYWFENDEILSFLCVPGTKQHYQQFIIKTDKSSVTQTSQLFILEYTTSISSS